MPHTLNTKASRSLRTASAALSPFYMQDRTQKRTQECTHTHTHTHTHKGLQEAAGTSCHYRCHVLSPQCALKHTCIRF
jgi:hypothetical protein